MRLVGRRRGVGALALVNVAVLAGAVAAAVLGSAPAGASPHPTTSTTAVSRSWVATPTTLRGRHRWRVPGGRPFVVVVPPRIRRPAPLVVVLGGLYWQADYARKQFRLAAVARTAGAVVAYPQPDGVGWNAGRCCRGAHHNDVGYLAAVRATVGRRVAIDPHRQVLLGYSNGGMLAYRAACVDKAWSAIAVIGATLLTRCQPTHPFSIANINGTADTVIPYSGGYSQYIVLGTPPVWQIDGEFAAAFGCGAPQTSKTRTGSTTVWQPCSHGVRVRELRISGLPHHFPLRETDGYDVGPVLWQLALPDQGAPAPS